MLADGVATWGAWVDAQGTPISQGHVTDAQGRIGPPGGATPHPQGLGPFVLTAGEGTQLYAGAIVRLAAALIG